MAFDINQSAHCQLREILKQKTNQVTVFAGAGLSRPAGIPTWSELQAFLINKAGESQELLTISDREMRRALVDVARRESNPWKAIEYLETALGQTSFKSCIYEALSKISNNPPPFYLKLWSLGITSFLTLNLDRFASRSYGLAFPGHRLREFDGLHVNQHTDAFKGGTPFVANLHGNIDDSSSWILTDTQYKMLSGLGGYRALLETCILSRTILFTGISADDKGATGHLENLVNLGLSAGTHFWLTSRNDPETIRWAERLGIRLIIYQATDDGHSELAQFINDIQSYRPKEIEPPPVVPTTKRERNTDTPLPAEVEVLPSNEIRFVLAKEAARILQSDSPTRIEEYNRFWKEYEEAIYRAWSISTQPGKNVIFDYVITDTIAKGAFAYVYKATDPTGKIVAIKILHGNIREEPEMIEAFRRGVAAMSILSHREVKGMVPYFATWEIPTCCVMELIDGPTLEAAVEERHFEDWHSILKIAIDVGSILRAAHRLPERVLHRDVRPANIMLKDFYDDPLNLNIVVLDFDLSWHRDASGLSVDLAKKENGYHAPEQLDKSQKNASRNALVDSFGFGMTLYFLVSKKHPRPSQHTQIDWNSLLVKNVLGKKCAEWKSLPRRFARIIDKATQDVQKDRWDLTRILGELTILMECISSADETTSSIEHVCEELIARCSEIPSNYIWDADKMRTQVELISGFTVGVGVDSTATAINANIEWQHTGDKVFKNVAKFVENASSRVNAELRKGGWGIELQDTTSFQCRIHARIPYSVLASTDSLQRAASALSSSIRLLRFN